MAESGNITQRIARLKLLIFDVDGVLTDGSIIVTDSGEEAKRFHVRDGFAIKAAQKLGYEVGIITGRCTRAVTHRAEDLAIDRVIQRCSNKGEGISQMCEQAGIDVSEAFFMGDDLIDLPAMNRAGVAAAPADAASEVREVVDYVTQAKGGRGAVREAIEWLLKQRGQWEQVIAWYEKQG